MLLNITSIINNTQHYCQYEITKSKTSPTNQKDFRGYDPQYVLYCKFKQVSSLSLGLMCTAHMLAGRTEPLSVWNQHERRPQTGSVVSAVTRVAQQDLKTHKHRYSEQLFALRARRD